MSYGEDALSVKTLVFPINMSPNNYRHLLYFLEFVDSNYKTPKITCLKQA